MLKTEAALIIEAVFSPSCISDFPPHYMSILSEQLQLTMPVIKLLLLIDLRNGFMITLQKDHKLQFPYTILG